MIIESTPFVVRSVSPSFGRFGIDYSKRLQDMIAPNNQKIGCSVHAQSLHFAVTARKLEYGDKYAGEILEYSDRIIDQNLEYGDKGLVFNDEVCSNIGNQITTAVSFSRCQSPYRHSRQTSRGYL